MHHITNMVCRSSVFLVHSPHQLHTVLQRIGKGKGKKMLQCSAVQCPSFEPLPLPSSARQRSDSGLCVVARVQRGLCLPGSRDGLYRGHDGDDGRGTRVSPPVFCLVVVVIVARHRHRRAQGTRHSRHPEPLRAVNSLRGRQHHGRIPSLWSVSAQKNTFLARYHASRASPAFPPFETRLIQAFCPGW